MIHLPGPCAPGCASDGVGPFTTLARRNWAPAAEGLQARLRLSTPQRLHQGAATQGRASRIAQGNRT